MNLYAYCANNAVMYVDPSGYSATFPHNTLDSNIYKNVNDYVDPGRLDIDKATIKRNTPGIVTGNFSSNIAEESNKIRSSDLSSIAIPKEVAQNLIGKEYNSFTELRQEIYKGIAKSKYAIEFSPSNIALMNEGLAPFAPKSLQSNRFGQKYNIDHTIEIQDGGYVYDLDNLSIMAPKAHEEKTKVEEKKRSKSKCQVI